MRHHFVISDMPKSEYKQEMPQSQTTDQPIVCEEEAKNNDREMKIIKTKQAALN